MMDEQHSQERNREHGLERSQERNRERGQRSRSRKRSGSSGGRLGCLFVVLLLIAAVAAGAVFAAREAKLLKARIAARDSSGAVGTELFPGDEKGGSKSSWASGENSEAENGQSGLSGSSGSSEAAGDSSQGGLTGQALEDAAAKKLASMTTEEKVLQLFFITPESLTGVDEVYAAGAKTKEMLETYPVGGLVYFRQNLRTPDQVKDMLTRSRKYSRDRIGLDLFTGVDEEGGEVARISGREEFGIASFPSMSEIGAEGDPQKAYEVGSSIGAYLSELGFNLDFAPVADVLTNPENTVVAKRSFGSDGAIAAQFVIKEMEGLKSQGVNAVLKHFPGHGGTAGDTHQGYAYTDGTLDQLMAEDLVPFKEGIDAGAGFIMAAHISAPQVTGSDEPASLSKTLLTDVLRGKLEFQGIIITDALNMGAITEKYSSAEAAVASIRAGADMLLMPANFSEAYNGVLSAVGDGSISEARLDESVMRILRVKLGM